MLGVDIGGGTLPCHEMGNIVGGSDLPDACQSMSCGPRNPALINYAYTKSCHLF